MIADVNNKRVAQMCHSLISEGYRPIGSGLRSTGELYTIMRHHNGRVLKLVYDGTEISLYDGKKIIKSEKTALPPRYVKNPK